MTFFADEGLDAPLVELLRKEGHTVIYAAEFMKGAADLEILNRAANEKAILITKDKDFGELVIRHQIHSQGVILIRIDQLNVLANCLFVVALINQHKSEIEYSLTVIEEDKIRIRDL